LHQESTVSAIKNRFTNVDKVSHMPKIFLSKKKHFDFIVKVKIRQPKKHTNSSHKIAFNEIKQKSDY
jgi:hypothetical protein